MASAVHRAVAVGHAGKAREFALVPRSRDHEAAAHDDAGDGVAPQRQPAHAQFLDDRLGALGLAVGGEHRARDTAGAARLRLAHRFVERHGMAAPRQFERLPEAENAPADDRCCEPGHRIARAVLWLVWWHSITPRGWREAVTRAKLGRALSARPSAHRVLRSDTAVPSREKRMAAIVALGDDTTDATRSGIERIFFASAGRTTFADEAERSAFRERWLGRYLEHDRAHAFLARDPSGAVAGYLVGCLEDPAQSERFRDISYYAGFADLTERYPAHLHINLDAAWRGRGIGAELIEAFARHVVARRVEGVHIVTGAAARNVSFYRRCGFAPLREAQWNGSAILFMDLAPRRRVTPAETREEASRTDALHRSRLARNPTIKFYDGSTQ